MKLKDYISRVLEQSFPGKIEFEVNLTAQGEVSDRETGNKVRFTIEKFILDKETGRPLQIPTSTNKTYY